MTELYRLIKSSIEEDKQNTLRILDKCYQKGLKSYQRLTKLISKKRLSEYRLAKARIGIELITDGLNKILDSSVNLLKK